jgi:tetratricopeptide (TPR) repeat protein
MILMGGVIEYRVGNLNLAAEQLERLAQLQPDNPQASQLLARVLLRQGKYRQLVERFDGFAHTLGASPYLIHVVGQAWLKLDNRERAEALFALARKPQSRPAAPLSANVPLGVAVLGYRDAPNAPNVAVPYIRALMQAGRGGEALTAADRLRNANPSFAEVHLLAGDIRMLRGDAAGALKNFQNAAKIRFNELAFARMDSALRALGKSSEADALDQRYLAQNPASIMAMKRLGASWRTAGRTDIAAAMDRALAARGQAASLR